MLPDFSAYREETHCGQADVYSHLRQHHYVHSRVGELRYAVMANTVFRPVVHRHLTALLPLDENTFEVFATIHAGNREKYLTASLEVQINKQSNSEKSIVLEPNTVMKPESPVCVARP